MLLIGTIAPAASTPAISRDTVTNINNKLTFSPTPSFPDRRTQSAEAQAYDDQQAELAKEQAQAAHQVVQAIQRPSGGCFDWMNAAGITDQAMAYKVMMFESGCNPNAVNASSGACGIGQQLPCGKWPHQWNDPVGAMIDTQNYVFASYGSWANAWSHEQRDGWY